MSLSTWRMRSPPGGGDGFFGLLVGDSGGFEGPDGLDAVAPVGAAGLGAVAFGGVGDDEDGTVVVFGPLVEGGEEGSDEGAVVLVLDEGGGEGVDDQEAGPGGGGIVEECVAAIEPVSGCAGVGALCCAPETAFGPHVDVVQLTGQLADSFGPVRALAADGGKTVLPCKEPGLPGGKDDRARGKELGRIQAVQHGGAALGLNEALGAGCDCDCELQGDAAFASAASAGNARRGWRPASSPLTSQETGGGLGLWAVSTFARAGPGLSSCWNSGFGLRARGIVV